jgi:putative hydrolase of the HAD superfamily
MPRFKGVVFDLDDTLYLERDYVRSGFRHVACEVARIADLPEESTFSFLWNQFKSGVRGNTFDLLLRQHRSTNRSFNREKLIEIYRSHSPKIELSEVIRGLLESLRASDCAIGIISDGALASQQAKVTALGLKSLVDQIVLTDTWGNSCWKPHPRGFMTLMSEWRLEPEKIVYVADNPTKDFVTPKKMGWTTVRVRVPGQLHFELEPASQDLAPHVEIKSYDDLRTFLLSVNESVLPRGSRWAVTRQSQVR